MSSYISNPRVEVVLYKASEVGITIFVNLIIFDMILSSTAQLVCYIHANDLQSTPILIIISHLIILTTYQFGCFET